MMSNLQAKESGLDNLAGYGNSLFVFVPKRMPVQRLIFLTGNRPTVCIYSTTPFDDLTSSFPSSETMEPGARVTTESSNVELCLTFREMPNEEMLEVERKRKEEAMDKARLWALYTRLRIDRESGDEEEEEEQTGDPSNLRAQEQAEFLRLKVMYPGEIGIQKARARKGERKAASKSFELQLRQKARELGITAAQLLERLKEDVKKKKDQEGRGYEVEC